MVNKITGDILKVKGSKRTKENLEKVKERREKNDKRKPRVLPVGGSL